MEDSSNNQRELKENILDKAKLYNITENYPGINI